MSTSGANEPPGLHYDRETEGSKDQAQQSIERDNNMSNGAFGNDILGNRDLSSVTAPRRQNTDIPRILPHEKVFPIQIGNQLFRLSGASISSDGMIILFLCVDDLFPTLLLAFFVLMLLC